MQSKCFTDPEEANAFIESLKANNTIDVLQQVDGSFRINWIENKLVKTPDGNEQIDEVWMKADGTLIVVQDLEPEHAKNIIRMILRNERERRAMESQMMEAFAEAFKETMAIDGVDELGVSTAEDTPRVLH
jgi:hypothetical protein